MIDVIGGLIVLLKSGSFQFIWHKNMARFVFSFKLT